MMKSSISIMLLLCFNCAAYTQELQARVSVNAQRVGTNIDKNTFTSLQTQLTNLLNTRKWTDNVFQAQEKIQSNFQNNIESATSDNIYKATLTVQSARPVFNSAYQTSLINFQDADFTFKYVQFQPLEFNENRVQGTDPLTGNLTAVFAYYVYMILGFDYDSFSPKGGEQFFQKAQNIVTNAPEARNITGWKSFDGQRNRYWLAKNITDARFNILHDIIYDYYRSGLDYMYEDEATARSSVLQALSKLQAFNQDNPNTMVAQFLVQGKSQELAGIFKKADPLIRSRAAEILSKVDIANTAFYKQELK